MTSNPAIPSRSRDYEALRTLEQHPGYHVLMKQCEAMLARDRDMLEGAASEKVAGIQGAAQRTRKVLELRDTMMAELAKEQV